MEAPILAAGPGLKMRFKAKVKGRNFKKTSRRYSSKEFKGNLMNSKKESLESGHRRVSVRVSGRPQRLRARNALRNAEGTRIRVKTACTNCKLAKARCDNGRPCSRCIKRGCQETCVDAVPKRRGRKRNHEAKEEYSDDIEKDQNVFDDDEYDNEEEDLDSQTLENSDINENHEDDLAVSEISEDEYETSSPASPKDKRRRISFKSSRLDYLVAGDLAEKTLESELRKEDDEEKDVVHKVPADLSVVSSAVKSETEIGFGILSSNDASSPIWNLESPNNTLSDSEFNALLIKNELEQSTPEFTGVLPRSEPRKLTGFNLAATMPMKQSISPIPFPLNALWSETATQQQQQQFPLHAQQTPNLNMAPASFSTMFF
eukprot:CAMPEP_0184487382 /NCGR_PEP_ID=MMETSP0113_2-20130426/9953_1 /TAXON_ID=91329 /ORGANISM="Norrisiella sphaerica, Strain BC52" /LENGTH=373 /DNA_ID=CAMNT_0026869673 /DNA_START=54 /DNA_END=1175 /DNA_ORIENTATION=-